MKKTVLLAFVLVLLLTGLPLSVVGLLGLQMAHASSYKDNFKVEFSSSAAYVSVPFHYQSDIYYCGSAGLEMVFDYYGEDISQTEIADVARTHPNVTYLDELRRAAHFSNLSTSLGDEMPGNITGYSARKIGYAAFEQGGLSLTIDGLKALINKGQPIIVLMWWTPSKVYGHYRVVVGYNETHIITHDPWNKDVWGGTYGGANTSMTYSMFLDLWQYSGNWGLLIYPWDIELQMPSMVSKGDNFEVTANITYPCSTPFDTADYPASFCKATIRLQEGLELALGETLQHSLGNIIAGNSVQTSWSIHASETGFNNISVTATGIVGGSVWAHGTYPSYSYEDEIGGSFTNSLSIINQTFRVHNIDSGKNFSTIQEAINDNATLDGHIIFVDGGTYYEHVVVNKSISLFGENKETTIIDGNSTGTVVHVTANNTNISDFTIQNSGYGILLVDSSDNNISANVIKNNQLGILLISSSINSIADNIVSHNEYGIILDRSSNHNNLVDNTVLNNYIGIRLIDSTNNILMGNIASDNTGGIELRSDTKLFSGNNTLVGNIASNNNGYGIHLFLSGNNTLVGNNVSDGVYGIYLLFSRSNTLSGNIASNNEYNFYVDGSIFDDFKNYVDISNTVDGKPIYYLIEVTNTVYDFQTNAGTIYVINANNVTVTNLTLTKNGYGKLLWNSTNSKIENITTSNNEVGIRFYFSSNNTIISNNVSNNQCGIRLFDSTSNIFSQNTVSNNDWGMKLWGSVHNTIYHNNFINNTNQVDLSESSNNLWDNGYPSGGNYWSNYNGTDADQDGIGDSPYTIDANNQDNYPLMGMFSDFTVWDNETYHITTICNFTISDFHWGYRMNINGTWEKALYFNVFGPEDTVGFCRIMIPRAFMEGPYTVLFTNEVNSTELPISNSTHVFLYITYNHSGHVMIVPEFPTWTSMLLILTVLTVSIGVYKRRLLKTPIH